jgi:hypothetical protein
MSLGYGWCHRVAHQALSIFLQDWIQGHSTGTLAYNPFNSALCQSGTIDKSKLWEYYW